MNPEQPAHGEVKVEQRHRDAAADFIRAWTNTEDVDCYPSHTDSIWTREGRADGELLVQAFARFEHYLTTPPATDLIQRLDQARSDALAAGEAPHIPYDWLVEVIAALRSPPATDVALREKLGVCSSTIRSHERKGNLEGLPGIVAVAQVLEDLSAPTPPDQPQIGDVERSRRDTDFAWVVPRHPSATMMDAGLYHCSADMAWSDLFTAFHHMVDAAEQERPDAAMPKGDVALPRLTDDMILAAAEAHYGKRNVALSGGISGIDLSASDRNYTFAQGFRRMWNGIAAALRDRRAK